MGSVYNFSVSRMEYYVLCFIKIKNSLLHLYHSLNNLNSSFIVQTSDNIININKK